MVGATTTTGSGASSPILSPQEGTVFNQEQCLFCNKLLGTLEANVSHMRTAHGLFIPDKERLLVDLETLLAYLHLVISGYNECICCGTQRGTALAVQQHMVGKGHCRFEIEDSEYADFYDFSGSEADTATDDDDDDGEDGSSSPRTVKTVNATVDPFDKSRRLPSGRIVANRSHQQLQDAPGARKRRSRARSAEPDVLEGGPNGAHHSAASVHAVAPDEPDANTSGTSRSAVVVAGSERPTDSFTKQLATLSANDERSLAHLSLPEQRAALATRQKQVEKARRVQRVHEGRVEGSGNVFLMTHFRRDAADKRTMYK